MANPKAKINGIYIMICCIAVCFSFFFHELTHWLTGTALGQQMAMTLNSVSPVTGYYTGKYDYEIVSAAGPLFTIAQAIICCLLMRYRNIPVAYPFLFTAFYMRLQATVISIFNANDEARISRWLGIGMFTLPLMVSAFLFYLVVVISRRYAFSAKFNLATLGAVILFSSAIILTDQQMHLRIL